MADSPLVTSPTEPSVYGQRLASDSPFNYILIRIILKYNYMAASCASLKQSTRSSTPADKKKLVNWRT